jgi:hypothetical protein
MTERRDQEHVLQQASREQLLRGAIDRREFLSRTLVAGLGMAGIGTAVKSSVTPALAADRPLTPTFYQWIQDLHPGIPAVNAKFGGGVNYQIAPVEGFGIERFVAEAKNQESTWDVYVGQTPFVEMSAMIKADVIEPWDKYIPKDVLDDMIPSIRAECTIDGKLYGWPFLLDVIGMASHGGIIDKAGSWFSYNSQRIGQGRDNVREFLKNNKDLANEIEAAVRKSSQKIEEELLVGGPEDGDE